MSNTTLFKHRQSAEEGGLNQNGLTNLIRGLRAQASSKYGNGFVDAGVSRSMVALESADATAVNNLIGEADRLSMAMEGIVNEVASGMGGKASALFSRVQKDAGIGIGLLGGALRDMLHRPIVNEFAAREGVTFIPASGSDMVSERMRPALEAFDEKDNQNSVLYSVAYNMTASRQDEFGETFFPTVIVTPDQVGFSVSIRIHNVMSDLRRGTNGELDKFHKRNIIQAVVDPSIFNTDNTRVVPVVRDEALTKFVAAADVAPYNVTVGEETVSTAPLKIGQKLSLINISQTEATLATGMMDVTDAIDSTVILNSIYVKTGIGGAAQDVFKFETKRLPFAVWTKSPQGNYRQLSLNFSTASLQLRKDKKTVAGGEPAALTDAIIGDYQVRLSVSLFGNLNQELGDTEVNAGQVSVASIIGLDGVELPLDGATAATIIAALGTMQVVGYDLDAQRVNTNRRQRGQLLDTTFYNQIYAVPLRSPLTILRPTNVTDETDATDLSALITATHIRTSNEAVRTLLEASQMLAEYVDPRNTFDQAPAILGVARDLVKATYMKDSLDLEQVVQSLTSTDRFEDIQNAMVNVIRDHVYNVYRDSNYQAAANALAGGIAVAPTVIIGTDPVIARYLMVSGDTRLLGDTFDVRVVTTLDQRMKGKLFVTFGNFASGKEGIPDPMHFGNMAWKPEATLVLPILRNGAYTKELTVQPSFLHIVNLPILIELDVLNITKVATGKVALLTHEAP